MGAQLGRDFGRLWSAYAVSTYGTWLAFGAFPLIAVRVLHSPALAVSLLEAAGLAVAAVVAVPLGPWVQHRAKRPVMIGTDLVRFLAMASIPIAYLVGLLKNLVRREQLLVANGRFEGTSWVATAAGPPLGGALIGLLGPVVTVAGDSLSYLLSALGVLRIRGADAASPRDPAARPRTTEFLSGWRFIFRDRVLRRLFLNAMTVNGLIMATGPLLAVLLLGRYRFPAWQYGLAFGIPALGGFAGARLSSRLVARYGRRRVMIVSGWLRSIFPLGLALSRPGIPGLLTVIIVEGLLIACMGIFNPISATERLQRVRTDQAAQVLSAWSISSKLAQASTMVAWGALATFTSPLAAITSSGILLLATPVLLPKPAHLPDHPHTATHPAVAAGRRPR
jgi:hypothetical protein